MEVDGAPNWKTPLEPEALEVFDWEDDPKVKTPPWAGCEAGLDGSGFDPKVDPKEVALVGGSEAPKAGGGGFEAAPPKVKRFESVLVVGAGF